MFYYVDGTVTVLKQGLAVIDCGGVGYACHASQNTIGKLKIGTHARLMTYLNVREGIFELYGFIDEEELSCFEMMIGVSGVGPKAALSILSVAPPDRLALSIITGDEKMLMQAPGTIIPTERFITHLWGWDTNVDTSVVWVHISNIRKKIAALGAPMEIRFVRNAGYVLEVRP